MASRHEKDSQDCCRFLTTAERILLIVLILTSITLLALFLFIVVVNLRSRNSCESPDCVKAAAKLLESINFNADPCEDLPKYICGQYGNNVETLEKMRDEKRTNIKRVLDRSASLKLPRKFHQTCTSTNDNSTTILLGIINELGGWPILLGQEWDETFHWLKFTARARSLGVKSDWFVNFDCFLQQDSNSTITKFLKIGVPSWSLPIPANLKQNYYEAMVKVAVALESSSAIAWRELRKVANFDENLRTIGQRARNKSLHYSVDDNTERTVGDLETMFPDVDLSEILNDISQGLGAYDENSTVIIQTESYLFDLNSLLVRTARRTQANFAIWKIIEWYLPYLSDEMREAYRHYTPLETREDFCFTETVKRYSAEIQAEYTKTLVGDNSKTQMQEMVDLISQELNIKDIQLLTGYPTSLEESTDDDDHMDFVSDSVLKMVNEDRYERENEFFECVSDEISSNCSNQEYPDLVGKTEIEFEPESKIIHISNDLLESSRYSRHLPNYLNYGSLGPAIAAKILRISTTEILPKSDLAYLGYLRKFQKSGAEKKLPGLDFTPRQLFWLRAAYASCIQDDATSIEDIITSEYFINDFNCNK